MGGEDSARAMAHPAVVAGGASATLVDVVRRLLPVFCIALLALALLAPAALGRNPGGQGLFGETNDVVVTNAGFLVIAFFPLFILAMSVLQWRLDKRKHARTDAKKRRAATPEGRGGW